MSTPERDYDTSLPEYHTPPALIAFTLSILILCFVAFSIVCICKYCFSGVVDTWAFQRTASGSLIRLPPNKSLPRGLDPTILEGFPTFLYANVKGHRKEKSYSLECAICLLEFEDDSLIRLLTICCHVFHKECIDIWLHSHKTCPVCRTELDSSPPNIQIPKCSVGKDNNNNHNVQEGMASSTCDDIRIAVKEGEGDDGIGDKAGDQRHEREQRDHHMSMQQEEQNCARSHSTGHSIVLIRGGGEEKDDDKYTLRLPEHVIRGGNYYCSRGCASCRDMHMTGPAPAPCSNCGFVKPVSNGSSSLARAQDS